MLTFLLVLTTWSMSLSAANYTESTTSAPTPDPTYAREWNSEQCVIDKISTSFCENSLGIDGKYYVYTLRSLKCPNIKSAQCIYDDSNGGRDCELFGDHKVGETRPCWVYYEENECITCDCTNCDDDSAGNNHNTFGPTKVPSISPTENPTLSPIMTTTNIYNPSNTPSTTLIPSNYPSIVPSITPSITPSIVPSIAPSISPSITPSIDPTNMPSLSPSSIMVKLFQLITCHLFLKNIFLFLGISPNKL